jgi:predicted AlkP superfamily phosphohydrolase/phosphomutase
MSLKALLIGLDGATYTVLDSLMERGIMPHLRELVDRGSRANLRSVIPVLTPPAWTSLMTGKRPGEHGIFDFFQREEPGSHYLHFASSKDVGTPTIWSIASDQGQRIISLNYPLMFPPPTVRGCVVPGGWMPWRQLRLGCYPTGLFDRLKALPSFDARELALDMAMEEKAIEGCPPDEYVDWIRLHIRRERRWFDILTFLLREEPADLAAVLFDGVDKLQHLCWRFLDPNTFPSNPTAWETEIRDLCHEYFRQLDGLIWQLVSNAGPDANVVIASDHGFGPTSDVFYLNTWLEREGYLTWNEASATQTGDAPNIGFGHIARHVFQLDWEHTAAYGATPTSNGIHLVSHHAAGDGSRQTRPTEEVRDELIGRLLALRYPDGRPVVQAVHRREETFAGPFEGLAPDLTLTMADGGLVSILRAPYVFKRRAEPAGTHRPEGVFLGVGPAFRVGETIDELNLPDVCPLLLYLLNLAIPEDLSGTLPIGAVHPALLAAQPVRRGSEAVNSPRAPTVTSTESVFDAEAELIMLKRLRALGYVE